jgi:ubiquinone/menaquinone biosynthesis C-methylase UbiE
MPLTVRWYRSVFERLDPGTHLLDIGIGTGGALVANADIVREKDLHVTGVDIDADYVARAKAAIEAAGLAERCTAKLESIYEHRGGPYGAAYFGASFMLMPDPAGALKHVAGLLVPGGRVYFTQTFQETKSPLLERAKPLLKKVTTIDFGRVTYEADFLDVVSGAGLDVLENCTLDRKWRQSFRCVVAAPHGGPDPSVADPR